MPFIDSALLELPSYANPYDTTSKNTPISVLVPHIPNQPGNGFEIPINAERSQFVQTGSLDFTGVTVTTSASIDLKTASLTIDASTVTVNAAVSKFSGVVQCDVLIANSVVGTSYTPGAGNIW